MPGNAQLTTDASYNKWLRATINIEIRGTGSANLGSGTAIILEDSGRFYLLTARHMLVDPTSKEPNTLITKLILIERETASNNLTEVKVPNGDFVVGNQGETIFIMNLAAGGKDWLPTIISSEADDIGIISLNHRYMDFFKTLLKRGYKPINITDIDNIFTVKRGAQIFALGFPGRNSIINVKKNSLALNVWESSLISVPVISPGVYLEEIPKMPQWFDAMIFVYHGFSGGPVVYKDKLIGIVSGGEMIEQKSTGELPPFANFLQNRNRFIKSTVILSTLQTLKDRIKRVKSQFNIDI